MVNKYDTKQHLKYNNYGFSDKSSDDVKTYLASQKLPLSLDTKEKRNCFIEKWDKDWIIQNGKLVHKPLNLTVVPDGERTTVFKGIY